MTSYVRGKDRPRGLVILEPWIDLILSGRKTWEMRKIRTTRRGPIALIRKGSLTIVGTAELVTCLDALDAVTFAASAENHGIMPGQQQSIFEAGYRRPWVLRNARRLERPVRYLHPKGAQRWIILDDVVIAELAAQGVNLKAPGGGDIASG